MQYCIYPPNMGVNGLNTATYAVFSKFTQKSRIKHYRFGILFLELTVNLVYNAGVLVTGLGQPIIEWQNKGGVEHEEITIGNI
jgi:hypothetical protein